MASRCSAKRIVVLAVTLSMLGIHPLSGNAFAEPAGVPYNWSCQETQVVSTEPNTGEVVLHNSSNFGTDKTIITGYHPTGLIFAGLGYRAAEKNVLWSWNSDHVTRHVFDSGKWVSEKIISPDGSPLKWVPGEPIAIQGVEGDIYSIVNGWLIRSRYNAKDKSWPVWREAIQDVSGFGTVHEILSSGRAIYIKASDGNLYRMEFDPGLHRIISAPQMVGTGWQPLQNLASPGADAFLYINNQNGDLIYRRFNPADRSWTAPLSVSQNWKGRNMHVYQGACSTDVKSANVPVLKLGSSRVSVVGSEKQSVLDLSYVNSVGKLVGRSVSSTDVSPMMSENAEIPVPVGPHDSDPAMVRLGDGRVQLFVRDRNGYLLSFTQKKVSGAYDSGTNLGGGFVTPPVAVQLGNKQFVFGADAAGDGWGSVNPNRELFGGAAWTKINSDVRIKSGSHFSVSVIAGDPVLVFQVEAGMREIRFRGGQISSQVMSAVPAVGRDVRQTLQVVGIETGFAEMVATAVDGTVWALHRQPGEEWASQWKQVSSLSDVQGVATLLVDADAAKTFIAARSGQNSSTAINAVEENLARPGIFKWIEPYRNGYLAADPTAYITKKSGGTIFSFVVAQDSNVIILALTRTGLIVTDNDATSAEAPTAGVKEVGTFPMDITESE